MARSTVAVVRRPAHDAPAHAAPANDASAHAAPVARTYALTDAHRARCLLEARAVPSTALQRGFLPSHLDARLDWMDATLNAAWRDRAQLAQVALDGTTLSESAIDEIGMAVLFARECVLRVRVAVPSGVYVGPAHEAEVAQLSDAQLSEEAARAARVVCDALAARLRVGGVSAERAKVQRPLVRKVRLARTDRARRHALDALVAYCAAGDCERWLRAQCLGEGAALDRLRATVGEWGRRLRSESTESKSARMALAIRAVAVALKGVQRIAVVGRYLTQRDPARRGDYAAFAPPTARRAKAKAPVGDPT